MAREVVLDANVIGAQLDRADGFSERAHELGRRLRDDGAEIVLLDVPTHMQRWRKGESTWTRPVSSLDYRQMKWRPSRLRRGRERGPSRRTPSASRKSPRPMGKGPMPAAKGPLATGKGPLPRGKGPLPTGKGPLPRGKGPLPRGIGPLPRGIGTMPIGIWVEALVNVRTNCRLD